MKDRVKEIRRVKGLTQEQFAEKIGLSRNYVAMIEIGQREPSDRTISDICRVFEISEDWLRYGLEPMKVVKTKEEEISEMVGTALVGSSEFKRSVVKMICSRSDKELEVLEAALRAIFDGIKNE